MKLVKITDDHYVIVDDSEIKEDDWLYSFDNGLIVQANRGSADTINSKSLNGRGYGKITHSTDIDINELYYISLQEVKELIGGEVDVEKKYNETWLAKYQPYDSKEGIAFKTGYSQALEDNKDRKYTEEDLTKMFEMGIGLSSFSDTDKNKFKYALNHIQPQTQWEVEFDNNGKLKLK